jgi:hypothetical protein
MTGFGHNQQYRIGNILKFVTLASDEKVPALSMGTWEMGDHHDRRNEEIRTRIQIRSATLKNGLGGRNALASAPLDRQVKVARI